MNSPLLNTSSYELNDINSYSDNLSEEFPRIIPLREEIESNEAYPFNQSEAQLIMKKEIFKRFKTITISRKYDPDDIRKKFKSNYHKYLRKIINSKLKEAGSKYEFESFPQIFITDVTKETNFEVMGLAYEQLFEHTYNQVINGKKKNKGKPYKQYLEKRNKAAEKKYKKNKEILEYLNTNKKLSEKSEWEKIRKMKYIDLLKAYLNSNEFQLYIRDLFKKEKLNYIKDFVHYASTYIEYCLSLQSKKDKSHRNDYSHPNSEPEIIGNSSGLNIPLIIPFPPPIFDITEDDNNSSGSLDSLSDDYSLENNNKIFTSGNLFSVNKI